MSQPSSKLPLPLAGAGLRTASPAASPVPLGPLGQQHMAFHCGHWRVPMLSGTSGTWAGLGSDHPGPVAAAPDPGGGQVQGEGCCIVDSGEEME